MKEKLTEQSILLFEKKGFNQTSIQDIVDSLGVTKGTFYYYFSSKEELLMIIHLRYINDLLQRQKRIVTDTDKSCKVKLKEMIQMLITDIKIQGSSARVFFREMRHLSDENVPEIKEKREQFRINIERLLEAGVDTGEFKNNLQVDIVAFGILGVTNWSYQWFNPNGKINDQELTDIYVDLILNGIEES